MSEFSELVDPYLDLESARLVLAASRGASSKHVFRSLKCYVS